MNLNIVLVEPEIPQNTGNIIRTCAATGATLHLVRPLGFSLEDKYLKRSGLDYWDIANIQYYDSFEEVVDSFIVFGKETKGLPESLIKANLETCIRIPMLNIEKARSLNLSNSVAIVVYEALRQLDYPGMR